MTNHNNYDNLELMAKRLFFQVEMSEAYRAELQRLAKERYTTMTGIIKMHLDNAEPTLKQITLKERALLPRANKNKPS